MSSIKSSLGDAAETLSAPLSELIAAVGRGVAEAQQALDEATLDSLRKMYRDDKALLLQLGYQPTWYRIPEADAEISVSLSISGEGEVLPPGHRPKGNRSSKIKLYAAPVDASYTNTYDYDFKAASVIRFKVVAVPPSPQAAALQVVPALQGKTFGAAKALLERLGITYQVGDGTGGMPSSAATVQSTRPAAGETLQPDQPVELTMSLRAT